MLEWDDFRVFLAIARHGSLTAAARALRVTQPTMGRRLEMLEERLGTRLFERTPTGPVLTDLGAAILNNAEQMEQAVLAAERRIAGHDNCQATPTSTR
jgi:molybdate transport repressor ModE-like protein